MLLEFRPREKAQREQVGVDAEVFRGNGCQSSHEIAMDTLSRDEFHKIESASQMDKQLGTNRRRTKL